MANGICTMKKQIHTKNCLPQKTRAILAIEKENTHISKNLIIHHWQVIDHILIKQIEIWEIIDKKRKFLMKSNKQILALLATMITFSVIAADYQQDMEEMSVSSDNGMNEEEEETETERVEDIVE